MLPVFRTHEQVTGFPIVTVGPYEIQFGTVDIPNTQVKQSEIAGLVDTAEMLLDLQKLPQGAGLVALPQFAPPQIIERPAEIPNLMGLLPVIFPGMEQKRIACRSNTRPIRSLRIQYGILSTCVASGKLRRFQAFKNPQGAVETIRHTLSCPQKVAFDMRMTATG